MDRTLLIRIRLTFQAANALIRAAQVKRKRRFTPISADLNTFTRTLTDYEMAYLIKITEHLVRYATFGTGRKCFFRSYILRDVLHRWNMPMTMHIGMKQLSGKQCAQGHCWLTHEDELFAESNNPFDEYPIDLGKNHSGLHYWLGGTI